MCQPRKRPRSYSCFVGGMIAGFYFYIAEPKSATIAALDAENSKLESEIQTLTIKVKHLDELVAANKQLEIELAKKEGTPPSGRRSDHAPETGV